MNGYSSQADFVQVPGVDSDFLHFSEPRFDALEQSPDLRRSFLRANVTGSALQSAGSSQENAVIPIVCRELLPAAGCQVSPSAQTIAEMAPDVQPTSDAARELPFLQPV